MLVTKKMESRPYLTFRRYSLAALAAFNNIPPVALMEIEKTVAIKNYEKHESIFLEDDPADSVWFVEKGLVKEIYHSAEGADQTVSMTGPQGMFGASAFEGGTYGYHAIAETDASVLALPIQRLQETMERFPVLAHKVLSQISKLLRKAKDQHAYSHEKVEKRLIHTLLVWAEEYGKTLPLTRREIGAMGGTTTETCIRVFVQLEEAGWIATTRGQLIIKNIDQLRKRMESL